MKKTFLVTKEYTTRNFMYVQAETEEEALKLADVGEGTADRYTEYEPVKNVSVQEATKIDKINNASPLNVKEVGYHLIEVEEKTSKQKLALTRKKAREVQEGEYVRKDDKVYQVYAKTEKELFIQRDVDKKKIGSEDIIDAFVDLKEKIESEAKNKVVVRVDIKQVDQLYARFIEKLEQIVRVENANYTYDELECYLEERQKMDWHEHQSATKYYINTALTDKELKEFENQNWIEVRTFKRLWNELSNEAKVVLNQIRRPYGEGGERKYFKASIGDKIDYRNDLAYDLTSQIEITQDVLYEVDKYADIVKTFECLIQNNTIEIWETENQLCG